MTPEARPFLFGKNSQAHIKGVKYVKPIPIPKIPQYRTMNTNGDLVNEEVNTPPIPIILPTARMSLGLYLF